MFTEETGPKAGPLLTQVSSTQGPRTPTWLPTGLWSRSPVPKPPWSLGPRSPPPATGSQVAAANGNSGSPRRRAALGLRVPRAEDTRPCPCPAARQWVLSRCPSVGVCTGWFRAGL